MVATPSASSEPGLFSPEYLRDPYPIYARLRQESPVFELEDGGPWALLRYEDVLRAFEDPGTFSSVVGELALRGEVTSTSS